MKGTLFLGALVLAVACTAGAAFAASTTVGASVARGQSDSMAYSLFITQRYEAWISNSILDLSPLAQIGVHAWNDDDSDVDTVWGAHFTPGLRLTINTDKILRPFAEAAIGLAVNSEDRMDDRDFGSHVLLRTRGSVGIDFGSEYRHRVQGDYTHHSTAGLTRKDDGYNTYGLSYGYSF